MGTKHVTLNDSLYSSLSGLRSNAADRLWQRIRVEIAVAGEAGERLRQEGLSVV